MSARVLVADDEPSIRFVLREALEELGREVDDVDDVDAAVLELVASGARVLHEAENGPHERRAVLSDPAGNPLAVYGAHA